MAGTGLSISSRIHLGSWSRISIRRAHTPSLVQAFILKPSQKQCEGSFSRWSQDTREYFRGTVSVVMSTSLYDILRCDFRSQGLWGAISSQKPPSFISSIPVCVLVLSQLIDDITMMRSADSQWRTDLCEIHKNRLSAPFLLPLAIGCSRNVPSADRTTCSLSLRRYDGPPQQEFRSHKK